MSTVRGDKILTCVVCLKQLNAHSHVVNHKHMGFGKINIY